MRKRTAIVALILVLLLIGLAAIYSYFRFIRPIPIKPIPDVIRLASWNIRVFSNDSRDDTELRQICRTIMDYDFVAVIELRDEAVLQRTEAMLKTMGKDYDYQISDGIGRGVKERYAFLYDKSTVRVVEAGRVLPDPDDVFIREPYYATFSSGEFDFTVIAVHIIWGKTVGGRRAEILKLADVYRQVQQMNPSEQDVILVGDFNREPDDSESYAGLNDIPSMISVFDLPQKSHIKDTSLYDNIWFQSDHLSEYKGTSGIDRFDETDFGNNDESASLAVSDHRPVWVEFHTRQDDD
jgi:endonuclease/exonuclease/phosphatase family metal-dependent hydrolase